MLPWLGLSEGMEETRKMTQLDFHHRNCSKLNKGQQVSQKRINFAQQNTQVQIWITRKKGTAGQEGFALQQQWVTLLLHFIQFHPLFSPPLKMVAHNLFLSLKVEYITVKYEWQTHPLKNIVKQEQENPGVNSIKENETTQFWRGYKHQSYFLSGDSLNQPSLISHTPFYRWKLRLRENCHYNRATTTNPSSTRASATPKCSIHMAGWIFSMAPWRNLVAYNYWYYCLLMEYHWCTQCFIYSKDWSLPLGAYII